MNHHPLCPIRSEPIGCMNCVCAPHAALKGEPAPSGGSANYYGGGGTIHGTTCVDVETLGDRVVSVWFRCLPLPFRQTKSDEARANEMATMYSAGAGRLRLRSVSYEDPSS